jgi:hypothetical protein
MAVILPDPDVLMPDNPFGMQPDHDESLSEDHIIVPDKAIWTPSVEIRGIPYDAVPDDETMWRTLAATSNGPNVKFPREIHEGVAGEDVIAHKRAISRARPDLYLWDDFTDYAGDFFMDAIVKWKKSKGLGTARVLGGRAHEVLEDTHRRKPSD